MAICRTMGIWAVVMLRPPGEIYLGFGELCVEDIIHLSFIFPWAYLNPRLTLVNIWRALLGRGTLGILGAPRTLWFSGDTVGDVRDPPLGLWRKRSPSTRPPCGEVRVPGPVKDRLRPTPSLDAILALSWLLVMPFNPVMAAYVRSLVQSWKWKKTGVNRC